MNKGKSALILILLLIGLTVLVVDATSEVRRELAITEACQAADEGRIDDVLSTTEDLLGFDEAGLSLVQCRCVAQLVQKDEQACFSALLEAIRATDGAFVPDGALVHALVVDLMKKGENERARDIAVRAAKQFADDPRLLALEVRARLPLEMEMVVLNDVVARLDPSIDRSLDARLRIARIFSELELEGLILTVLGDEPPSKDAELKRAWFVERGRAVASTGDAARTADHFARYAQSGAPMHVVNAHHAAMLTRFNINDPERPIIPFLEAVLAKSALLVDDLDPGTHEFLFIRLSGLYAVKGETERAQAIAAEARKFFPEILIDDDELRRANMASSSDAGVGTIAFEGVPPGARLLVSPDPTRPADTPFTAVRVDERGRSRVSRPTSDRAVHFVLTDASDVVVGGGSVWPRADEVIRVDVTKPRKHLGEVSAPLGGKPPEALATRQMRDGRRRVVALLLDGGDWRLVRLGIALSALPTFEHLVLHGRIAVVDSDPPFTGVAIQSIVRPSKGGAVGVMRQLVELGEQVAAFRGDHANPIASLSLLAPDTADLFAVLGRGERRAVNLMLSHGAIDAGETFVIRGPRGETNPVSHKRRRPLRSDELERYPVFGTDAESPWMLELPAVFESTLASVDDQSLDFVLAHIDATDRAAHTYIDTLERSGVELVGNFLIELYRFVDEWIAKVVRSIDADDVLIVFSDHGMKGGLAHDRASLFIAYGGDVQPGRVAGEPALRGLPRVFADLLGEPTDWESTGLGTGLLVEDAHPSTAPTSSPRHD
jgi:hypothetical protein